MLISCDSRLNEVHLYTYQYECSRAKLITNEIKKTFRFSAHEFVEAKLQHQYL